MFLLTMPCALLFLVYQLLPLPATLMAAPTQRTPKTLNVTTIAAAHGASILECWQLTNPFMASTQAGTTGAVFAQLGMTGATSYAIIPPNFAGGLHNAPAVQYVAFMSGEAVISLPTSRDTATVQGGKDGLILAVDTANTSTQGHITNYPSKKETIGIQIPTLNNEIPPHTVLYPGPCIKKDKV